MVWFIPAAVRNPITRAVASSCQPSSLTISTKFEPSESARAPYSSNVTAESCSSRAHRAKPQNCSDRRARTCRTSNSEALPRLRPVIRLGTDRFPAGRARQRCGVLRRTSPGEAVRRDDPEVRTGPDSRRNRPAVLRHRQFLTRLGSIGRTVQVQTGSQTFVTGSDGQFREMFGLPVTPQRRRDDQTDRGHASRSA